MPYPEDINALVDIVAGDEMDDAGKEGDTVVNAIHDALRAIRDDVKLDDITDVDLTGIAAGSILFWNGTNLIDLAIGTAGQVLKTNAGATAPEWAAAVGSFSATSATVAAQESTTSTSYADLATIGPAVTVTTSTEVLVIVSGELQNGTTDTSASMSFAVSGATTLAASDERRLAVLLQAADVVGASLVIHVSELTAGSNTFTAKYRVGGGSGLFTRRRITVIPL